MRSQDLAAAADRGIEPLYGAARAQAGGRQLDHLLPALVGTEHTVDTFICQHHDTALKERDEEKDTGAPRRAREPVLCECRAGALSHVALKQGLRQKGAPDGIETGKAVP